MKPVNCLSAQLENGLFRGRGGGRGSSCGNPAGRLPQDQKRDSHDLPLSLNTAKYSWTMMKSA